MSNTTVRFLQQENIRLTKEIETLTQHNQALSDYLDTIIEIYWMRYQIFTVENPLEAVYELLYKVQTVIGAKDSSIVRLDEETGELEFVLVHGELNQRLEGYRIKGKEGVAGWVTDNKEPIIVNYPRQDWRFSVKVDDEFDFLTQSIASVPIMTKDRVFGALQMLNKQSGEFTQSEIAVMLTLSQLLATVLTETKLDFSTPVD